MVMAQVSSLNLLSTSIGDLIVRCDGIGGRAEPSIHRRVDCSSEGLARALSELSEM